MPMAPAPGRISARAQTMSEMSRGRSWMSKCRIAGDSSWLTPSVSPARSICRVAAASCKKGDRYRFAAAQPPRNGTCPLFYRTQDLRDVRQRPVAEQVDLYQSRRLDAV